jgi:hypothetical protein
LGNGLVFNTDEERNVRLSGVVSGPVTFTVTSVDGVELGDFVWLVNGEPVSNETGSSYVLDTAGFGFKDHTLTVNVTKDGWPNSQTVTFTVGRSL